MQIKCVQLKHIRMYKRNAQRINFNRLVSLLEGTQMYPNHLYREPFLFVGIKKTKIFADVYLSFTFQTCPQNNPNFSSTWTRCTHNRSKLHYSEMSPALCSEVQNIMTPKIFTFYPRKPQKFNLIISLLAHCASSKPIQKTQKIQIWNLISPTNRCSHAKVPGCLHVICFSCPCFGH